MWDTTDKKSWLHPDSLFMKAAVASNPLYDNEAFDPQKCKEVLESLSFFKRSWFTPPVDSKPENGEPK